MDLDFLNEESEIATSGSPSEIATGGGPNVITSEIYAEARKLAASSKGLDIAKFQKKYNIHVMNVDELLKRK